MSLSKTSCKFLARLGAGPPVRSSLLTTPSDRRLGGCRWPGVTARAAVAAAGLSSLHWGGRVAEDNLEREGGWNERLGMTWLIALARFWASANLSIIDSTASPKRPFNSTLRSASLRLAKVSHICLCWTTMNPMVRPIAWAARFVAISAKSVAARRSFIASGEASTCENMACVADWTRADWGADHVLTSWSWTSG